MNLSDKFFRTTWCGGWNEISENSSGTKRADKLIINESCQYIVYPRPQREHEYELIKMTVKFHEATVTVWARINLIVFRCAIYLRIFISLDASLYNDRTYPQVMFVRTTTWSLLSNLNRIAAENRRKKRMYPLFNATFHD